MDRKLRKRLKSHKAKIRDYLDYDYLEQLNEEELEWLAEFSSFYYHGNKPAMNKVDEPKPPSYWYRHNNARIRDIYSKYYRLSYDSIPEPGYELDGLLVELLDAGFSVEEAESLVKLWSHRYS